MKHFMDKDFLLQSKVAKELYHDYAERLPIIDFHNHLNTADILADTRYDNIATVWLGGDHYKWRGMRANGISEERITGSQSGSWEQFVAWADTVQNAFGNPLYHWTHLELQRYFGIDTPLTLTTARDVWDICNAKLQTPAFSVRHLLEMQNVETLCTTDDPVDDLANHQALRASGYAIQVLPTFRPEKAIGIEKPGFAAYIAQMEERIGRKLDTVAALLNGLKERLAYFIEQGCRVTDHSLESSFYVPASEDQVNTLYQKRLKGDTLTETECAMYHGFLLVNLGREYARHGLVMQLHIGALRNNSARMLEKLGVDHGFDSLADFNYAAELSALLNAMDETDELPKTVLYYLNPKDAEMLAAMCGNFQSNEQGIRGKMQLGTAWWFCDHKQGMERQIEVLESHGLLSAFIGMLTDSRSFLSFPRHEYFRRILCNHIGNAVKNGEYPKDMSYLGSMVENICYHNAKRYFNL